MRHNKPIIFVLLTLLVVDVASAGIFGRLRCRRRARRDACCKPTTCQPACCDRTMPCTSDNVCPKTLIAVHKSGTNDLYYTYSATRCMSTTVGIDLAQKVQQPGKCDPCTGCFTIPARVDATKTTALEHIQYQVCHLPAYDLTTSPQNGATIESEIKVKLQGYDRYAKLLTIKYNGDEYLVGYEISEASTTNATHSSVNQNCYQVTHGGKTYYVILQMPLM